MKILHFKEKSKMEINKKTLQATFVVSASIAMLSSWILTIYDGGGQLDFSLKSVVLFVFRMGYFFGLIFAFGSGVAWFLDYWSSKIK